MSFTSRCSIRGRYYIGVNAHLSVKHFDWSKPKWFNSPFLYVGRQPVILGIFEIKIFNYSGRPLDWRTTLFLTRLQEQTDRQIRYKSSGRHEKSINIVVTRWEKTTEKLGIYIIQPCLKSTHYYRLQSSLSWYSTMLSCWQLSLELNHLSWAIA